MIFTRNCTREALDPTTEALFPRKLTTDQRIAKIKAVTAALPRVLQTAGHEPTTILPRFSMLGHHDPIAIQDETHTGWLVDERWQTWVGRERGVSPRTFTEGRALYMPAEGDGLTYCRVKMTNDRVNVYDGDGPLCKLSPGYLIEQRFNERYLHLRGDERERGSSALPDSLPEYTARNVAVLLGRFVRGYECLTPLEQSLRTSV